MMIDVVPIHFVLPIKPEGLLNAFTGEIPWLTPPDLMIIFHIKTITMGEKRKPYIYRAATHFAALIPSPKYPSSYSFKSEIFGFQEH
jgi:hypothetical protein